MIYKIGDLILNTDFIVSIKHQKDDDFFISFVEVTINSDHSYSFNKNQSEFEQALHLYEWFEMQCKTLNKSSVVFWCTNCKEPLHGFDEDDYVICKNCGNEFSKRFLEKIQ